jgi:uncharacterized protein
MTENLQGPTPGREAGAMSTNGQVTALSSELAIVKKAMRQEVEERPPTIGVIGVSGVGKSSTINTLFRTNFATSDTTACTKAFQHEDVELTFTAGEARGSQALLRVFDAPGLGESIYRDPEYLTQYHQHLPWCDVIIWIMAARNRGLALDQSYLQELKSYHGQMVFGINQVDLTEPMDWHLVLNGPSPDQEQNIERIVQDRREKLQQVLGREVTVIPYSARARYNLQEFFTAIIEACPDDRRWIFSNLKAFRPDDFLTEEARRQLEHNSADGSLSRLFGALSGWK